MQASVNVTFNPVPGIEKMLFSDISRPIFPSNSFSVKLHKVELALVSKLLLFVKKIPFSISSCKNEPPTFSIVDI